jgi:Family of unknown function (DUF5681)
MSIEDVNPKRPANGLWRKGTSGNPAGRPTGSRNQSTVFFQELLNGQGEALIQKGIELSLKGDTRALGICWDRLLPARKERTIELPLPSVTDAKSVSAALASVVTAVAEGSITPGEAESLARVLEAQMRAVEFEALAQRVVELEKAQTQLPQATEPGGGSTLEWLARNYSNQTSDSGMIAEAHPEHSNGHDKDGEEQPPQAPGASTPLSETKGNPR